MVKDSEPYKQFLQSMNSACIEVFEETGSQGARRAHTLKRVIDEQRGEPGCIDVQIRQNLMTMTLIAWTLAVVLCSCGGGNSTATETAILESNSTAERINYFAVHALDDANLIEADGEVRLYGTRTNGPDTKHGGWACAKVVSIVLKKAGAFRRIVLGVRAIEAGLKDWQKIDDEDELRPGDVIVWVSKSKGRKDAKCTGGGNCHVGIVSEKGYFHNSPMSKKPTFGGFSLWGFRFKNGLRPPN